MEVRCWMIDLDLFGFLQLDRNELMSAKREKSEREQLKKLLRDFDMNENYSDQSIFHFTELTFGILELEDFDESKNKDLWRKFREMLKGHPAFKKEWNRNHFKNHGEMEKYYWWRDPENWK